MRYAFDTNIWRYLLTDKAYAERIAERAFAPLGLPSIVIFELLTAARNDKALRHVEDIFRRLNHAAVAPTTEDWTTSAMTLRKMTQRFRFEKVGLQRLSNDALIAQLCARLGWTLVTANRSDFERLALVMGTRAAKTVYLSPP